MPKFWVAKKYRQLYKILKPPTKGGFKFMNKKIAQIIIIIITIIISGGFIMI